MQALKELGGKDAYNRDNTIQILYKELECKRGRDERWNILLKRLFPSWSYKLWTEMELKSPHRAANILYW